MFSQPSNPCAHTHQPFEKMITGTLEGKLVATQILIKQGMDWQRIAELMDMTEEQIACVAQNFH